MYIPPYDVILNELGLIRGDIEAGKPVTIPAKLFKVLLEVAVSQASFDEKNYLDRNPDVKEAVSNGSIANARRHYVGFGYFENRRGGTPPVDHKRPDRHHWLRLCIFKEGEPLRRTQGVGRSREGRSSRELAQLDLCTDGEYRTGWPLRRR